MKIKKVEIEGFRAYKSKKDGMFDFTIDGNKPSNFIVIYAPNGFGKSSFFDAVEWAFTANLERFIVDHNRKNNELAAISMQQTDIAQNILRNKYINEDVVTSVRVDTTKKVHYRALKPTKPGSRDLRFHKNETEKGMEFIHQVILSQDAIDRFIREIKPQERYNLFMEYFGGETERLRQELTVLINDNKRILDRSIKQRDTLQDKLKVPIDESVFSEFNIVAKSLNEKGECVKLVSTNFTEKTEHEAVSFITTRTHELSVTSEKYTNTYTVLMEQLAALPNIQNVLNSIKSQEYELEQLIKNFGNAHRYKKILELVGIYEKDIELMNKELIGLKHIQEYIPEYFLEIQKVAAEYDLKLKLEEEKIQEEMQLKNINLLVSQHKKDMLLLDKKKFDLSNLLSKTSFIYSKITESKANLTALKTILMNKNKILSSNKISFDKIDDKISNISKIEINVKNIFTQDLGPLNINTKVLIDIQEIDRELSKLEINIQNIQRTQKIIHRQAGVIEQLVSLGLEFVNSKATSTCPLCQLKHTSYDGLKESIESNISVSELIIDNAHELEELNSRKNDLVQKLNSIVIKLISDQKEYLAELRLDLSDLTLKIDELEYEKSEIISKILSTQEYIDNYQSKTFYVGRDEFENRLHMDLENVSNNYKKELESINIKKDTASKITSDISCINIKIQTVLLNIDNITSNKNYKEITLFLEDKNILLLDLEDLYYKNITNIESKTINQKEIKDNLIKERDKLRNEITIGGNYFDIDIINEQKENIASNLVDHNFQVNSFFKAVSESLGREVSKNSTDVKSLISEAANNIIQELKLIKEKLNSFTLLLDHIKVFKPYIHSLLLQKELVIVKSNITKHDHVDKVLSKEREVIFLSLRNKIEEFFYTDLINSIYSKIDPHPSFKKVDFVPDFLDFERPKLNVVIKDDTGVNMSPNLYFSAAQLNILSLSIFLAKALHAKDNDNVPLDVILIDDPIQSMDSINIIAMIDLLRNISVKFDKQIIISTHDENFFKLLQLKIPTKILNTKFLTLKTFGVVAPI